MQIIDPFKCTQGVKVNFPKYELTSRFLIDPEGARNKCKQDSWEMVFDVIKIEALE